MAVTYQDISLDQAKEFFENGTTFIDIREPEEFQQDRIPGATLLPMSEMNTRLQELPKDEEVVLYCRTGNRSSYVLDILSANGYNNLMHLDGGIQAWYNSGLPVDTDPVESKYDQNTFEDISPKQAHTRLEDSNTVFLDVREPYEYNNGHAPKSVNVPLGSIQQEILQYDEDTPILLICASGNRSSMAADWLAKNGYSNVANVQGGMYSWQSNRLPVE